MEKTMPYSLYKSYFSDFKSENYNKSKKTIDVILPDYTRPKFPKTWTRSGNHYHTPNGFTVTFWNTGLAESFLIEKSISAHNHISKQINPGLYARENVISFISNFE